MGGAVELSAGTPRSDPFPAIGDYALIGDSGTAALVSRDGAIEWLCLPHFHGSSVFAAMLDRERGGRFSVRPRAPYRVERRYLAGTNVLETTFTTDDGVLRLTDLLVIREPHDEGEELWPDHELLRELRCVSGEVEVDVDYEPRPHFGRAPARLVDRGPHGLFQQHRRHVLILRSDLPLELSDDRSRATAHALLRCGDRRHLALAHDVDEPAVLPLLGDPAEREIERSVEYWRGWSARTSYRGPHPESVERSLLALKLLTFSPSGAVVAAPTTSLPETIGGERNWDYRFCWLRDASFTVRALADLGFLEEARAFVEWLLNAIGGTQSSPQIVYDVFGSTRIPERELGHLEGYRGSRPVRVGNDARAQLQLDIYGEAVDAVYNLVERDGELGHSQRRLLRELGESVCERWREPDNGLWEKRAERRHHTHSKVLCWVALDRLLKLHEDGRLEAPARRFREHRDRIREDVERHGWNDRLGSYVAAYGGHELDACLLLLPLYGYVEADDPRMRSTYEAVQDALGRGPLLYRYLQDTEDGLEGDEGAFGICCFWAVEVLARMGRVDEARERFARLLDHANDLGLYAEEIDPESGAALGNFPQAFTHVGLINAALTLARIEEGRAPDPEGAGET